MHSVNASDQTTNELKSKPNRHVTWSLIFRLDFSFIFSFFSPSIRLIGTMDGGVQCDPTIKHTEFHLSIVGILATPTMGFT